MNSIDPRNMVGVDQLLAILDYMKDNPQLAHSRFSRTKEGRSLLKRHWAACADLANNISSDCTQKTPDQWRWYYNAYKSKLKKKVTVMKAELVATGGAPAKTRLSDLENRLYLILGPDLGEQLPRVCNTPVSLQRLENEHQPSSSTAEALLQDDTNFTICSDSSDVELYYPEEHTGHLAAGPVGNMGQLAADSVVHTNQQLEPVVHNVHQLEHVVHNVQQLKPVVHNVHQLEHVVHNVQQLEPVVHTDQRLERVVHNVQKLEPMVHNDQQLEPVVHNVHQLEHVVHNVQKLEPMDHNDQQLEPVVHNVHQLEHVVHNVQKLEPLVHPDQRLERVVHTDQRLERVVHTDQRLERVVHTVQQPERGIQIEEKPERVVHVDQQLEPMVHTSQQPEFMVRSGHIKKETIEGSSRRLHRRASSEQDGGPALREATDALFNVERMKIEAKRHATAALNRLAGAMEAIAERLGGPVRLQVTSPPRARRRYARIYSSESD